MPQFTTTRHIEAPPEKVWEVLDKFGDIAQWSPGVKNSELTSDAPVGEGSTRHCDFSPLGGVNERIETYVPNERMTIDLYETFKLPIVGATADFNIAKDGDGTALTIDYSYKPNRLGRIIKRTTEKQMRQGMSGLAEDLQRESERLAAS
jgi:uncharacterized protein YndB with AHSA1/START domain